MNASDRVFTLLFHGTGEHRDVGAQNEEALHVLTDLIEGNVLVNDGPGAGPPSPVGPAAEGVNYNGWLSRRSSQSSLSYRKKLVRVASLNEHARKQRAVGRGRLDDLKRGYLPWVKQDLAITTGSADQLAGSWDWTHLFKRPKRDAPPWADTDTRLRDYGEGPVYHDVLFVNLGLLMRGMTMGEGMDDLIRYAMVMVAECYLPPPTIIEENGRSGTRYAIPDQFRDGAVTINVVGWSRGGVACIRFANWMYRVFGNRFRINLFTYDPVPGATLGEQLRDTHTLAPNVAQYVSIICLHDQRTSFKPVDGNNLVVEGQTELALLPMPGFHATPLYFGENKGTPLHSCPEVGRYLAYKFLQNNGTRLTEDSANPVKNFSPLELCELYAEMMLYMSSYATMTWTTWAYQTFMSFGKALRDVFHQRPAYVARGSYEYFLNEHHVACFWKSWPDLAKYAGVLKSTNANDPDKIRLGSILRLRQPADESHREAAIGNLAIMREQAPNSYRLLLIQNGGERYANSDWLPEPGAWVPTAGFLGPKPFSCPRSTTRIETLSLSRPLLDSLSERQPNAAGVACQKSTLRSRRKSRAR